MDLVRENNCSLYCIKISLNMNLTLASFIKYPYRHVNSSSVITAENTQFMNHCLSILFSSVIVLWLFILLMRCSDIHPLPGSLSSPTSSSISSTSSIPLPPYDNHLGICHLNVQSIVPKLDILQYEMQMFDIFFFTETWINSTIKSSDLKIVNFKEPFRGDSESRSGGVAIYVKDSIECARRCNLEVQNLESVWVQINTHSRKILICGIYRPPIHIFLIGI